MAVCSEGPAVAVGPGDPDRPVDAGGRHRSRTGGTSAPNGRGPDTPQAISGPVADPLGTMFGSRRGDGDGVTCVACGTKVDREDAREYDKEGDRWDRAGKEFEYLCRSCHRELCHQPRGELEGLLTEIDAGENGDGTFLEWYCGLVEERYGPIEE